MKDAWLKTRLKDPVFYKLYHRALAEEQADEIKRLRMERCFRALEDHVFTSYTHERRLKASKAEQRYMGVLR